MIDLFEELGEALRPEEDFFENHFPDEDDRRDINNERREEEDE